jgi:hypothetical protein
MPTMRIVTVVLGLVCGLACGPAVGDEDSAGEGASGTDTSTGATTDMSASGAVDATSTSISTSAEASSSTSVESESSEGSSTDGQCEASCESLDEPTCRLCRDCSAIDGSPWQLDPQGQSCIGESVYLGCQTGVCFGQTHTWCAEDGVAYEIDDYCHDELFLEPCERPSDRFRPCP